MSLVGGVSAGFGFDPFLPASSMFSRRGRGRGGEVENAHTPASYSSCRFLLLLSGVLGCVRGQMHSVLHERNPLWVAAHRCVLLWVACASMRVAARRCVLLWVAAHRCVLLWVAAHRCVLLWVAAHRCVLLWVAARGCDFIPFSPNLVANYPPMLLRSTTYTSSLAAPVRI